MGQIVRFDSREAYEAAVGVTLFPPYVASFPSETEGKSIIAYGSTNGTDEKEIIATAELTNKVKKLEKLVDAERVAEVAASTRVLLTQEEFDELEAKGELSSTNLYMIFEE